MERCSPYSCVLTDQDYKPTGEFRLIRGITGNVISVPLVAVTLSSSGPSSVAYSVYFARGYCRSVQR